MTDTSTYITAIVAMTKDRVIGKDGGLPWHYPEDLKRFKRKTLDSTVIMGRKTWESIGSKPLTKRRNIVISGGVIQGVECYSSIQTAIAQLQGQIWIIGGGQIYKAALKYCDAVDVTWIAEAVEGDNLIRFPLLADHHWRAHEPVANQLDARLTHQLYRRIR